MRITEAQLRKIVRQEAGRLIREAPVRGMDVTKFIAADGEEWTEAEILASMEGEFLELGGDIVDGDGVVAFVDDWLEGYGLADYATDSLRQTAFDRLIEVFQETI